MTGAAEVEQGWEALWHMAPSQWFVVLSNVAFLVAAWFARARRQWIRMIGFLFVAPVSALYHLGVNTTVTDHNQTLCDLDRVGSVYLSITVVLLFAHFRTQLAEIATELVLLPSTVLIALTLSRWAVTEAKYVLPPAGTLLLFVLPSWYVNKGMPPARRGWLIAGCFLASIGASCFLFGRNGATEDDRRFAHGVWHLGVGLGSSLLVYALRDPALLQGYVLMGDL